MSYQLYHGDCLEIAPTLSGIDAIVSDPPYGIGIDTAYQNQFTGGKRKANSFAPIEGDDQPFDPMPWAAYPKVILWGYPYFAKHLPVGTTLVWCKRREGELGKLRSDCELAWQKGGYGIYMFWHLWRGFDRASERGEKTLHPSQKPIALMRWCVERLKLPQGATILDPYMGAGSTGVAAVQLGYRFIGIEKYKPYYEIAEQRIAQAAQSSHQLALDEVG